jgi:general secretion pathway protein I
MRTPRGMAGFTLLEVTIALLIAALATAALLQAAGAGLRATSVASRYDQAIVRAKSHLAAATHGAPLRAGDTQGDDGGGFHWRLTVVPIQTAMVRPGGGIGPRTRASLGVVLYRVVATISWQDDRTTRQVTLQTEQVGGA